MKKMIVILLGFLGVSPAFAWPQVILTCELVSQSKVINITVSRDESINGYGLFAVSDLGVNSFERELHTNLKWRDDSSHYRPENFVIFGKDFNIFYDDFSRTYGFSGRLFNRPINQKISCK